jgi:UrcA family protein
MKHVIVAVAVVLSAAASAQAQTYDSARQISVRYDDINVREAAGARVLLARIERAAAAVCGPAPSIRNLDAWAGFRACKQVATDRAIASLPFDVMANLNGNSQSVARR